MILDTFSGTEVVVFFLDNSLCIGTCVSTFKKYNLLIIPCNAFKYQSINLRIIVKKNIKNA